MAIKISNVDVSPNGSFSFNVFEVYKKMHAIKRDHSCKEATPIFIKDINVLYKELCELWDNYVITYNNVSFLMLSPKSKIAELIDCSIFWGDNKDYDKKNIPGAKSSNPNAKLNTGYFVGKNNFIIEIPYIDNGEVCYDTFTITKHDLEEAIKQPFLLFYK
jgi:hypothetical protein